MLFKPIECSPEYGKSLKKADWYFVITHHSLSAVIKLEVSDV